MAGRDVVKVLGIDPGLGSTGYGVVVASAGGFGPGEFGVVTPGRAADRFQRLYHIHQALADVIRQFGPDEVAVEDFITGHVRAAVAIGEARAVAVLAAVQAGLPVFLYKPGEVKQFVTSYGRGSKAQVQAMVQALLGLDAPPGSADAADALAVALCHCLRRRGLAPSPLGRGGSGP